MAETSETRQCAQCAAGFTIVPEDFVFYEKMAVPPPRQCPDCRMQRRMAFRNERALFRGACALCKKTFIGAYREGTPFPVYCQTCWWSDNWDVSNYSLNYDPSRSFLEQLKELQGMVPRPNMNNVGQTLVNSDYTNCAGELKNCYLIFGCMYDEDCLYSHYINYSKDCIDALYCIKSEHCYECLDIENCFELMYSQSCVGCRNSAFLFDCRNVSDSIGCVGLRNKQYHILNIGYTKEEYEQKKLALQLDTRTGREAFRKEFAALYNSSPRKYYHGQMNKDFSGDYIANTENTHDSFYIKNARGSKFVFWSNNCVDVYDYFSWGDIELSYECVSSGEKSYRCLFTDTSWTNDKEIEYGSLCFSSSYLFGCIGLRNKQYCILNKQYSEDEYRALRKQIIADMAEHPYKDKQGIAYSYGEFSPIELSVFPYNDSVAQEHFPLTSETASARGFRWADSAQRDYAITRCIDAIPDAASAIEDGMINDVFECAHKGSCNDQCTVAFKLIPHELQFYKKYGVPLPTLCHNCRHADRVRMRNPLKLWDRNCQCVGADSESAGYKNTAQHFHATEHCPNTFKTAYSPERTDLVYCEQCYQAEIV